MASQVQGTAPLRYGVSLGETILGGFRGSIAPVRPPLPYRLALLLVAVAMVLLPLIYVGLIAGVIWAEAWYAVHGFGLLAGGSAKARLFVYVAPLIVGAILVVFMVKPLFARPAREGKPLKLGRDQEPILFDFVERISAIVGSPMPREIHVDCQVNASASFRRGFLSLFGADLVLTIGLPLTAGLSLRQLAGVLAHELGHFGQRAGMRLTYVVRSVDHWFSRVVYERDRLDEWLADSARESDVRIGIVLHLASFFVWLTRKILWALMMAGHGISCVMMRQMEFDADRYEARLVGPEVFESTVRDLIGLSVAYRESLSDLGNLWQEGRLADSLPHLVAANHRYLAGRIAGQIDDHLTTGKTGFFDTHPADRDRIASVAGDGRCAQEGVFSSDLPATALFRDFSTLEKSVSFGFYREVLGEGIEPQDLVPASEALEHKDRLEGGREALGRYFPETLSLLRPLALLPERILPDPGLSPAKLQAAYREVESRSAEHALELRRYHNAEDLLLNSQRAQSLLQAGVAFKPQELDLPRADEASLGQAQARAEQRLSALDFKLLDFERADVRRLVTALALSGHPDLAGQTGIGDLDQEELARRLSCAAHLAGLIPRLHELRRRHAVLGTLWMRVEDNGQNQALIRSIETQMVEIHSLLQGIHPALRGETYPFDHARGERSVADLALPDLPDPKSLQGLYRAAGQVIEAVFDLYLRLLGCLVQVAEQVEACFGLAPLAAPEAALRPPEPPEV